MATSAPKAVPKIVPPPAAAAGETAAPKSKKKLFIVLGLVLALLGGGAAWYFLVYAEPPADAAAAKPANTPPVFMVLESFTVNLQTNGSEQFLQTSLTLQVANDAQIDLLKLYMPEVRNRLLFLLSSKQAEDILTVDGKKKLADDIVATLKTPFSADGVSPAVSNVFFTSFVIQ